MHVGCLRSSGAVNFHGNMQSIGRLRICSRRFVLIVKRSRISKIVRVAIKIISRIGPIWIVAKAVVETTWEVLRVRREFLDWKIVIPEGTFFCSSPEVVIMDEIPILPFLQRLWNLQSFITFFPNVLINCSLPVFYESNLIQLSISFQQFKVNDELLNRFPTLPE